MRTLSFAFVLLIAPAVVPAAAQDALEEAKAQYSAAAYEEALSTLTRAADAPPVNRVELEQYRAFCLIALGRPAEAERAIAALVAADPMYVPSQNVASPKTLSIVADMRKKELPSVARRLLDEGRIAFKEKEFARAQRSFDLLRKVLDDAAMKGRPETEDLRVLADGFAALSVAVTVPAAEPRASTSTAPMVQADTMIEAVPVQQEIPVWIPPNAIAGAREYTGAIKVRIGIDGRVKGATIERPTYPSYDARLLHASRQWIYKPATRNGEAIESDKVIPIKLSPRG
jgi:tetratricopeptide (TPR) repeat protein